MLREGSCSCLLKPKKNGEALADRVSPLPIPIPIRYLLVSSPLAQLPVQHKKSMALVPDHLQGL
jgi:hypothetical protein